MLLKDMMLLQINGHWLKSITCLVWAASDGVKALSQVRFLSSEVLTATSCKAHCGRLILKMAGDKILVLSMTRRYASINWLFLTINSLERQFFTLSEDPILKDSGLSVTFITEDNSNGSKCLNHTSAYSPHKMRLTIKSSFLSQVYNCLDHTH